MTRGGSWSAKRPLERPDFIGPWRLLDNFWLRPVVLVGDGEVSFLLGAVVGNEPDGGS